MPGSGGSLFTGTPASNPFLAATPKKTAAKKVAPAPAPTPPGGPSPLAPIADGPPQPALQAVGYNGGIVPFNARVAAFVAAHTKTRGVPPSPGLTLDFARSQVPVDQFTPALSGPVTKGHAAVAGVVKAAGGGPDLLVTPDEIIGGLKDAVTAGREQQGVFFHQHFAEIAALAKDPVYAAKIHGITNPGEYAGVVGGIIKTVAVGSAQVSEGLVHSPGAVLNAATGLSKDIDAAASGDPSFKNTRATGGALVRGTKEDFKHPQANAGFLFMDILGLASLGAGGAARVGAASRATGAAATAKALVTKPLGGTVEIGAPGATEHAIVSDNPLVGTVQKWNLNRRQKKLDETLLNGERVPAGLAGKFAGTAAKKWLDEYFSLPTKVGREADARRRVDHIVDMTVARELDHVAGGAPVVSRVRAHMPAQVRRGLTRGEDKAIQTVSFGVTPDDQIEFHHQMIDAKIGDPKDHLRQIADLELAKKVLASPNPPPRFRAALDLTRQVKDRMEQKKIEDLGLSPLTAGERVGKPGITLTGEKGEAQDYPATGPVEPFYTKLEPRDKGKRAPSDRAGFFAAKAGPYGVPLPKTMPELTHEFTGSSIAAGDFRIDASHLTSEAYARTVRAATVLNEHQRLWKASTETPKTRFDVPIRDSQTIPDELRGAMQDLADGGISQAEAEALPEDMKKLIDILYPSPDSVMRTPIDGVRWIDSRTMGGANDIPSRPGALVKAASAVNEPLRDLTLFLRPSYILNALGNVAMLTFHQGFAAVPSMARALHDGELGADTTRTIDALMGSTRSKSYTTGIAPKVGQKAAQAWSVITDRAFRRSSFLYEAKRLGYKTPAEIQGLVGTSSKDLVEIKRRANKALVEFDNLTEFEKNTLRHFIFVYPWVSRATVWSLRSVMEHPAKTAVLAQLGQQEADSDPLFSKVPEWFKSTGYVAVGHNADGTPKVINPSSVNTFSTLGDITNLVGAGLGPTKYTALDNLLGPAASIGEHAVTGRDDFGNPYPDKQWLRAATDVLTQLPQVSAFQRAGLASGKNKNALKPFDITDRSSLEKRMNSALKHTVFTPGWLNGYGSLLAGGLSPRGEDPLAAEARYWKDATPEQRHAHELDLLQRALGMQADFLKRKVTAPVRNAVKTASDLTQIHSAFTKAHGRGMTSREQTDAAIEYLGSTGKITPAEERKLKANIPGTNDSGELDTYRTHIVLGKAGGYDALHDWDADVRNLASFGKDVFGRKFPTVKASQPALYEYGRKYLDYTSKAKALAAKVADGKGTSADLRVFQDEHDKPVGGLPSFSAMDWANTSPDQQGKQLRSAAGASWESLSGFEKNLLGVKTAPTVSAGWKDYDASLDAYRKQNPGHSLAPNQVVYLVNEENKQYPGFAKDWELTQKPKIDRFEQTNVYKQMPAAAKRAFDSEIGASAKTLAKVWKSGDYKTAELRQTWKTYVEHDVPEYLDKHPALKQYLSQFNRDFLTTLEEK